MNRRTFLSNPSKLKTEGPVAAGNGAPIKNTKGSGVPRAPRVLSGLETYMGTFGEEQLRHLLRRTLFQLRTQDMDALKGKSMTQVLDLLLSTSNPAPGDLPIAYYRGAPDTQGMPWVDNAYSATIDDQRLESVGSWWLNRMISQGQSIHEKMTLFWHNHFVSTGPSVKDARLMYKQNSLLRANALGNFKDLTRQITFDPGMLRFLNGNTNYKAAPNENYGRELQELFTIGKGPEISTGNYTTYTEDDVKSAARVLTGWKDNPDTQGTVFVAANHDTGDKVFSAAYGNVVIKGGSDEAGARREFDEMLTMIFSQFATALYISRKLYRWFVYYEIDAATESTVIAPMAQLLIQSNYEVLPVLRALFSSAHFYDANNVGCLIKSPMDFALGLFRVGDCIFPGAGNITIQYYGWIGVKRTISSMAMALLSPPNVAGWPAYYQEPLFHEIWINTDTLQKRTKLVDDLVIVGYQLPENSVRVFIDSVTLAQKVSDPSNPNTIVDEWATLLLPIAITADQRMTLKATFLGSMPDSAWSSAWNAFVADPTEDSKRKVVEDQLKKLLRYMLAMPEYQLS